MKKDLCRYKKKVITGYWFNNKTSRNLPGERWKPIPEFEETHEVSNYGRVRCLDKWIQPEGKSAYLRKGHLMSPSPNMAPNHLKKDFTYHLKIGIETKLKTNSFSVFRLVYHCFIKPINLHEGHSPDYFILAKDGNGLNSHYTNLVKRSRNEKQQRVYQKKRNISNLRNLTPEQRKTMWQKGAYKVERPVTKFDKTGRKITSFKSIHEAGRLTGIRVSSIGNAVRGAYLTAGGVIWRYGIKKDFIKLPQDYFTKARDLYTKKVSRPVTQYDLKGERVCIYDSAKQAGRITKIATSNIVACLHGRLLSTKGFIWKEGRGKNRIGVSNLKDRLWKSKRQSIHCYKGSKKIGSYTSINQAVKTTGISRHRICKIAEGNMNPVDGLLWKYD
jgi:NUMOD4 motif/NUMOD1 domain